MGYNQSDTDNDNKVRTESFMGVSGIEPNESDDLSMQYRRNNQFDNNSAH